MPPPADDPPDEALPKDFRHPTGTLVIVGVFGLLFALAWLGTYLFTFLGRGAPHH
jgi:hypothetical protein